MGEDKEIPQSEIDDFHETVKDWDEYPDIPDNLYEDEDPYQEYTREEIAIIVKEERERYLLELNKQHYESH